MSFSLYTFAYAVEYEDIYSEIQQYDKTNLLSDYNYESTDYSLNSKHIMNKLLDVLLSEIKSSWKLLAKITFVCILSAVIKSFSFKSEIRELCTFSYSGICIIFILSEFKVISDLCLSAITNTNDYMSFSVPLYASAVSGCGYTATASTMQSIFIFLSVIISNFIVKVVYPLLYFCGIMTAVNGISSYINLSRFIKIISKIIKYALGIITTIFAGIITFAGLSSNAGDNIAIKTIKFTISNFVPVVGTCLSDALNSIIGSSHILKNSLGYIGYIVLISVCLIPVIKLGISVIIFRLSASVADLFSETNISTVIDSVCDVLSTMVSILVFVIAVFVLIIGIMLSVG